MFLIPAINNEKGALIEPLSVGLAGVNITEMESDDSILVTGFGTIGLVTIAALKSKGFENIIASDISDKKLELAKTLGAKFTFNPSGDGSLKDMITTNYGIENSLNYAGELPTLKATFECSGVSAVLSQSIELMAPDGKITILAIYGKELTVDPNAIVYKRLNVKGSLFYTSKDFLEAIEMMDTGKVDLTPIVSHHFPLNKLLEAFKIQAYSGKSVKVIVDNI